MLQLIKRPGAWQVGVSTLSMGGGRYMSQVETWPDYMEHDLTKECVLLRHMHWQIPAENLVTFMAAVAESTKLVVGFRSGSKALGGLPPAASGIMTRWFWKDVCYRHAVAAAAQENIPLNVEWDFTDDPVILNPSTNTFAAYLDGPDATTVFDNGDAYVRISYAWAKASAVELGAYLGWEALG